jgi:hypothetical protein
MGRLGDKLKGKVSSLRPRSKSPAPTSSTSSTSQPPSPPPSTKASPAVDQKVASANRLWDNALKSLSEEEQKLLSGCPKPDSKLNLLQDMLDATEERKSRCEEHSWKTTIGNDRTIILYDQAVKIVQWLNKFKTIGDVVVNYDPIHAALPWAGFRFLLEVRQNLIIGFSCHVLLS